MQPRLTLNSEQSSCLSLWTAGIPGVCHHTYPAVSENFTFTATSWSSSCLQHSPRKWLQRDSFTQNSPGLESVRRSACLLGCGTWSPCVTWVRASLSGSASQVLGLQGGGITFRLPRGVCACRVLAQCLLYDRKELSTSFIPTSY